MKTYNRKIKERLLGEYTGGEADALARAIGEDVLHVGFAEWIFRRADEFSEQERALVANAVERLLRHEPMQRIAGFAWFCGRRFEVDASTLIPRPETQELVAMIAADNEGCAPSILDIGTGSGCIAVSLAGRLPHARVAAWDISTAALDVARRNANNNGVSVAFERRDALDAWPAVCFDIVVSNPPYIPPDEMEAMERNVKDYEPGAALFVPQDDPLLFYREIAWKARGVLSDLGRIYFEINSRFAAQITDLLATFGYGQIEVLKDYRGKKRFVKAVWHEKVK